MSESPRVVELFTQAQTRIRALADRVFALLMVLQLLLCVVLSFTYGPRVWGASPAGAGAHLWVALGLAFLAGVPPVILAARAPGQQLNGFVIAFAQMIMGIVIIHLTHGRIESHFHVFSSIGMLSVYRDWRLLVVAVGVAGVDHLLHGLVWWPSIYGDSPQSNWLWLEHAAWAIFPVPVLSWMCVTGTSEMRAQARREADLGENELKMQQQTAEIQRRMQQEAEQRGEMERIRQVDERRQEEMRQKAEQHRLEREAEAEQVRQGELRDAAELRSRIDAVVRSVKSMAEGNFARPVPLMGEDAVGQMGQQLNHALRSVQEVLREVRQVADRVAVGTEQLGQSTEEFVAGESAQAASHERTTQNLHNITDLVKQNSVASRNASHIASRSRELAQNGGQIVDRAVEAMEAINRSSKRIAQITATIDEIAFQTNLLALNAAVEAARAGEEGRGFAVVASEVRNLAQRSSNAAKEISELIRESVRTVENGTVYVNQSGSALREILASVHQVSDLVGEIAQGSERQSTGIDEVNRAMHGLDHVLQENAARVEEMSATIQALSGEASHLAQLVNKFVLDEGPRPGQAPQRGRRAVTNGTPARRH